ncbi:hypothetical protein P9112_003207 [Eukaryota sp. TZLM1-RC]
MSVSPRQDTDSFEIFMQQYDRDAFSIHTTSGEVVESNKEEDSGSRPPSATPQEKPMEPGTEPPPASSKPKTTEPGTEPPPASSKSNKPEEVSGTGPPPSSPKDKNVGSSSETSSVLKDYEELQSTLEEMDDEEKELRQQIIKDAEAHLEPTDYCLFQQLPPLWKQMIKSGRNVGFQTLGHTEDPNRVYEFPQSKRRELINALDALSRETYGRGAERRPKITGNIRKRATGTNKTPTPQPPRRRVSSEEPLRLEDLQASRNILDMSIASSLQWHVDSRPRSAEYKAHHLSEKDPLNKMSLVSFLLKFQTWDKYGRKIANRSFQAPGQSDWSRAMLIATQIFGEGKTQIIPELLLSLPSHIREEIDRDMKQPLLRIDSELTKRLGPPIHHYDLFRSMMISTCPSGLSSMVDPHLISRWQGQGLLRPDFSDADLMVFLLRRTQFTSYHEACSALGKPCINWRFHNKMDAVNEFVRFVEDFGDVLRMTTYMIDHSISASIRGSSGLITLSPALIAEYFLLDIDNFAITKELASHWTREDLWDPLTGTTFLDLISTTRRHLLAWCQTTGNRHTMELLRKQAEREDDISLGFSTMRTSSRGANPSGPDAKRRSGGGTKGTPQNKYVPEIMNGRDLSFVHSATSPKEITLLVTRNKVLKELRFKIGEADQPARSDSVVRGRGDRGRLVSRFRGRGRGGHFRGHKGRSQYRPIHYINTQEETSSKSSPSENVFASSSMTSHRRIDRFSNSVRNTGNFPNRKQINAINHNQSIAVFGNPVINSPTAQQFLLKFLQFHKPSSDINSIFGINSTVSENHIRSQCSPFLRLEILINNIKMIATIDSAALCSVITEDLANKCNMSINRDDTIEFLPANNVSSKSLGSANGILSFNIGSIAH